MDVTSPSDGNGDQNEVFMYAHKMSVGNAILVAGLLAVNAALQTVTLALCWTLIGPGRFLN